MTKEEKEEWLYEAYQYTSNFDFSRLDKYEEANDDICIDDLILDYTMLYEFHKEEIEKLKIGLHELLKLNNYMIHCSSKRVIDKLILKQWYLIYETLGEQAPGIAFASKGDDKE